MLSLAEESEEGAEQSRGQSRKLVKPLCEVYSRSNVLL